jgi:UDP-N-acetylmuramoyl-tripeptide--D-alanyl-D-alanine ligase
MKPTDIQFIAEACRGRLLGDKDARVFAVKIDSRVVQPGDLFVAVVGENKNGHSFAESAYDAGCRAFLFSEEWYAGVLLEKDPSVCVVLARDTVQALQEIASAYLSQFKLHRLAVTGSVGKTSTKEMTARILSTKYNTVFTQGNLNTHLGLCLTAFLADERTQAIVFEMGMDRSGEIGEYCRWVLPEIAIITNVGTAHLEKLGTREAIAAAKLEIAREFGEENILVFNCDSDYLSLEEVRQAVGRPCILCPVGESAEALYRISDISDFAEKGMGFRLSVPGEGRSEYFQLPLIGTHNALNAALAVAAGGFLGVSMSQAKEALSAMEASDRHLQLEVLGEITLIDDTYNAGPDSMRAALDTLAALPGKRKMAVLADILELGSYEKEGHLEVGRYAAFKKVDVLVAIGKNAKYYAKGASEAQSGMGIFHYDTKEEALLHVPAMMKAGDVILVKGSNATGMAAFARELRKERQTGE